MRSSDLFLILGCVAMSTGAQFMLKIGASTPAVREAIAGPGSFGGRALVFASVPTLWTGLFVYGVSALLWIVVLSRVDISLAYPFLGVGFVLTFLVGALVLGEAASPARLVGTLMIAAGVAVIARSA